MKRSIYILLLMVMGLTSCIYDYDPVVVDADSRIVLEGDIIIGGETQIMASYMMALDDYEIQYPKGIAWVEDNRGTRYYDSTITPNSGEKGHFFTINTKYAPNDGRTYRVCFIDSDSGNTYQSEWVKPIKAPAIKDIFYDYDDENVNVRVSLDGGNDAKYFRWDYKETWRYHAEYVAEWEYNPMTGAVTEIYIPSYDTYYCWASSSPTEFGLASSDNNNSSAVKGQVVTSISRSSRKMSMMYKIELTARGMSKDSYTYHKNMLEISDLTGSLFSASPDDMRGNIVCANDSSQFVIGYVEAVQLSKKIYYLNPLKDPVYIQTNPTKLINPEAYPLTTLQDWWEEGYVPIQETNIDGVDVVGWGEKRCVDCALLGGTYEQPDDWDPYGVNE